MKKTNRYILLAVMVLALLLAALVVQRKYRSFRNETNSFSVGDTSNVMKIFMSDKNNNTLLLERTGPYTWTVNGKFAGSAYNIGMLLQTMLDIEVRNPVAKAAYDNTIRQLAVSSVKVEVYQRVFRIRLFGLKWFPHVKLTKVYYVGGPTPDNRGSFALMEGSDQPYVIYLPNLRGFVTPRFMPIEKYWRDYTVFKTTLPAIREVKVEIPAQPSESFLLQNSKSAFRILPLNGGAPMTDLDTINVLNFLNGFRNLNFEALLNDVGEQKKDSILSLPPFMIISLTDTAGVTKRIVTFRKPAEPGAVGVDGKPLRYDPDRLYALVNDGRDLVLIQYYTFDRILRPRSFFLKDDRK
jgi:hypothetical protein